MHVVSIPEQDQQKHQELIAAQKAAKEALSAAQRLVDSAGREIAEHTANVRVRLCVPTEGVVDDVFKHFVTGVTVPPGGSGMLSYQPGGAR